MDELLVNPHTETSERTQGSDDISAAQGSMHANKSSEPPCSSRDGGETDDLDRKGEHPLESNDTIAESGDEPQACEEAARGAAGENLSGQGTTTLTGGISYVQAEILAGKPVSLPPIIIRPPIRREPDPEELAEARHIVDQLWAESKNIHRFTVDDEAQIKTYLLAKAEESECTTPSPEERPIALGDVLNSAAICADEFICLPLSLRDNGDGGFELIHASSGHPYGRGKFVPLQLGVYLKRGRAGIAASQELRGSLRKAEQDIMPVTQEESQAPGDGIIFPDGSELAAEKHESEKSLQGDSIDVMADVLAFEQELLGTGVVLDQDSSMDCNHPALVSVDSEDSSSATGSHSGSPNKEPLSSDAQLAEDDKLESKTSISHDARLDGTLFCGSNGCEEQPVALVVKAEASSLDERMLTLSYGDIHSESAREPLPDCAALDSVGCGAVAPASEIQTTETTDEQGEQRPPEEVKHPPESGVDDSESAAPATDNSIEEPFRYDNDGKPTEDRVASPCKKKHEEDSSDPPVQFFYDLFPSFAIPVRSSFFPGPIVFAPTPSKPIKVRKVKDRKTMGNGPSTPCKILRLGSTQDAAASGPTAPSPGKRPQKPRMKRCGVCPGCLVKDVCGECTACKVRPRFGGDGKTRKGCEKRICENPSYPVAEGGGDVSPLKRVKRAPSEVRKTPRMERVPSGSIKRVRRREEDNVADPSAKILVANIKLDLYVPRWFWISLDGEWGVHVKRFIISIARAFEQKMNEYIEHTKSTGARSKVPFRLSSNRDAFDFEPVPLTVSEPGAVPLRIEWCIRRDDASQQMLASSKLRAVESHPGLLRLGCTTLVDVLDPETLEIVETETMRVFRNSRDRASNMLRPGTYQHTLAPSRSTPAGATSSTTVTRTKMFFGARYLWNHAQLSSISAKRAGGIRIDVERPPRYTTNVLLPALYRCGAIQQDAIVNQVAINVYHTGTTGIAPHFDDNARFELPVTSIRIFSDSRLSFGCRGSWGIGNGEFQIPMMRNSVLVLQDDSYASSQVKHCVRPCDMRGRSGVVLFRKIHETLLREAFEVEMEDITERFARCSGGHDLLSEVRPVVEDLVREVCADGVTEEGDAPNMESQLDDFENPQETTTASEAVLVFEKESGHDLIVAQSELD